MRSLLGMRDWMQYYDFVFLSTLILQFIPSLILGLLYLLEMRTAEGQTQKSTLLGFSAFTLLAVDFLKGSVYFHLDSVIGILSLAPIIRVILGVISTMVFSAAILLLASWILAVIRPEWLHDRRLILAVMGLILWLGYTGAYLFGELTYNPQIQIWWILMSVQFYILIVLFVFSLGMVLVGVKDDRKVLLLFIGVLIFYLNALFGFTLIPVNGYFEFNLFGWLGVWVIFSWYVLARRLRSHHELPVKVQV